MTKRTGCLILAILTLSITTPLTADSNQDDPYSHETGKRLGPGFDRILPRDQSKTPLGRNQQSIFARMGDGGSRFVDKGLV